MMKKTKAIVKLISAMILSTLTVLAVAATIGLLLTGSSLMSGIVCAIVPAVLVLVFGTAFHLVINDQPTSSLMTKLP